MKVVILAGGAGTRISEESQFRPKPMIEIGGMPILWHIMKTYSHYGFNDFIICAGCKQKQIKSWFAEYALRTNDVRFDPILGTGAYRVSGGLETTDRIMNDTFWVGVYPGMSEAMLDYMAESITEAAG